METLARAVGKWLEASKGELDRVTYASMRVNPNELLTAGHGDDDVCHDPDPDPGHDPDPGDDHGKSEFGSDPDRKADKLSYRRCFLKTFCPENFVLGIPSPQISKNCYKIEKKPNVAYLVHGLDLGF